MSQLMLLKQGVKMLHVDSSIKNLYCIQIPLYYQKKLVDLFFKELKTKTEFNLPCKNCEIKISVISGKPKAIVKNKKIDLYLNLENLYDLIEAIEEHLEDETGLPLDHSLEAEGFSFFPEYIKDVVIETIEHKFRDDSEIE